MSDETMSSENEQAEAAPEESLERPGGLDIIDKLLIALALVVALVHCTQIGARIGGEGGMTITPADMLLPIAFVLLLIDRIRKRDYMFWKVIPLPAALLIVWSAASIFLATRVLQRPDFEIYGNLTGGIKDIIQLLQLFIAVYLIYHVLFRSPERIRLLMWTLFAGAVISVGWAWMQYMSESTAMEVRAGFDNRNVFAGYLALIIPLVLGYSLISRQKILSVLSALLAIAALGVITSGGQFIALSLGIVVVAWLANRYAAVPVMLALLAGFMFVLPLMPRDNQFLIYESLALYRVDDTADALEGRQEWAQEDAGSRLAALRELRRRVAIGDYPEDEELRDLVRQLPGESDYAWPWQQRFQEWQSAMNIVIEYPLFGVGAGAYQDNINRFWRRGIPLPEKFPGRSLMENGALGMYPVRAAVSGLPGMVFLVWLIFGSLGRAATALKEREGIMRGLAAGCFGAIISMAIAGLFTDFLVRGLGITFAIVITLTAISAMKQEKSES